jgi:hypothetical protein
MTWTDKLAERGYYTYKVVPVNTIGHGDRVSVGALYRCWRPTSCK